jgi:hypothetical protein
MAGAAIGVGGAEGLDGVGVANGGGEGATATCAVLCRHPVARSIATPSKASCGSACRTSMHSAARSIVELFGQFSQGLRRTAQRL